MCCQGQLSQERVESHRRIIGRAYCHSSAVTTSLSSICMLRIIPSCQLLAIRSRVIYTFRSTKEKLCPTFCIASQAPNKRFYSSYNAATNRKMGKNNKKKSSAPDESHLLLSSTEASAVPLVDTHTHLLSTFEAYTSKYPSGSYETVYDFVRGVYNGRNVEALVDVYCEAPVKTRWKELADSAISPESRKEKWNDIEYWFVMGMLCYNSLAVS